MTKEREEDMIEDFNVKGNKTGVLTTQTKKTNQIQKFENAQFGEIRVIDIEGEPWFVGKDVAEVLGYSNPQKAVRDHIEDDDKTLNESFTVNGTQGVLINESGLYSLILSSKLPKAKEFKKWVTSEVLPSIRKNGMYITKEYLLSPDFLLTVATKLKEEQEAREKLEQKVEQMKPKVEFADAVSASEDSIPMGDLAKYLKQNGIDIGRHRLFDLLRDEGYLIKNGKSRDVPTQKSMEMKLFEMQEVVLPLKNSPSKLVSTTRVTPKGQEYFINRFLRGDRVLAEKFNKKQEDKKTIKKELGKIRRLANKKNQINYTV